jgi:hypothetical protein
MNVKITGIDHVVKAIARKKEGVKVKIHTGLVKAAYVILSKARYYCPISPAGSRDHMGNWQPPGALRASGQVLSVERPGFGSEARVSFGGLAAFYALWVHELTEYAHASPTCAKFLERAVRETRGTAKQMVQRELTGKKQYWIDGEDVGPLS